MGDDKVGESPAEVFATVAEVNSVFHSLEDMLETRFEAIDGRFGVLVEKLAEMDARNEGRFTAIEKNLAAMDARNEGKFDLLEQKFKSQDLKIEHCVTSTANKLMIMLLVIAGSIIATILHGG